MRLIFFAVIFVTLSSVTLAAPPSPPSGSGLLTGCSDNQIMKWDDATSSWGCEADAGAAGGDSITVDTAAVTDPDFASTGDIDFVDTSNTITANINANAVGNAEMADNAVDSAELVAGSVDLAHMSVNSVDSDQYVDGSVDPVHLADADFGAFSVATGAATNETITVTDNESTAEGNALVFVANADLDGATDAALESDGDLTYNPSTGTLAATILSLSGDATIGGDDLFMTTNTDTAILIADGTNFNPVVPSGDVSITNAGATTVTDLTISSEAQGDVLYFNGSNWVRLAPGTDGQFLESGGAGANINWGDPAGSGDITAVGDGASGAVFTADGGGNSLYFEGTTANTYEIALTGANPGADVTVTIPAETGTIYTTASTIDGEQLGNDTVDDDSIDFADVTGADLTLTDATTITASGLVTANAGLTVATGQNITLGVNVLNSGDLLDGEQIANDTIDDDSIDFTDVTLADITFDVGSVDTTEFGYLNGVTSAIQTQLAAKADIAGAEDISGVWTWADDTAIEVGGTGAGTADWTILYDETTDDRLEIVHAAGAGADAYFDLNDNVADSTFTITNSDGTYEANLSVEGDMTAGGNLTVGQVTTSAADDAYITFDPETANESQWWVGVNHDSGGSDNDNFEVRQSATPGSAVELYVQPDGDTFVTGDLTVTGDDLFMTTNTDTAILIADGTNFNPVVPSGDVSITNAGATTVTDLTISSEAQGSILYFNGSNWVQLGPSTDGYYLETNGAGANPTWSAVSASAAGANTNIQYNSSGNLGAEAAFTYNAATDTLTVVNATTSGTITMNALDGSGAVDLDYGSADITDHTFVSDGGTTIIDGSITSAGNDLGSATAEWNDLYLNDGGVVQLGADQDVTLTHVADTGVLVNSTRQLQFGDSGTYVNQGADGDLDLVADTNVEITVSDEDLVFADGGANQIDLSSNTGVTDLNMGSFNLATTGTIRGAVSIVTTTDGTESPTAAQMYGTMFIADHATAANDTDYTLPGAAAGMAACFYDNGAGTGGIIIDAAAGDEILLDGTGVGVADAIDSPGVAGDGANGDFICLVAIDATSWITMGRSGTWVDGGVD